MVVVKKLSRREKKRADKLADLIDLQPVEEAADLADQINLGSIVDLDKIDDQPVEPIKAAEPEDPGKLENTELFLKLAEEFVNEGTKKGLQRTLSLIHNNILSDSVQPHVVEKVDKIFKTILKHPVASADLNVWIQYAEFCRSFNKLFQATEIFQNMSRRLLNRLDNLYKSTTKKMFVLALTFDIANEIVIADFKGDGHYTRTYKLSFSKKSLGKLIRESKRVMLDEDPREWLENIKNVGQEVFERVILEHDLLSMFQECSRNKGIVEFKIDEEYIEFPIELLFHEDFVAPTLAITKQILNLGSSVNRKPLSAAYYGGEEINALLIGTSSDDLVGVNEEIRSVCESLVSQESIFRFKKVTCLTDDRTIVDIDSSKIQIVPPTKANFNEEIRKDGDEAYQLLHFAGHGRFDKDYPDRNSGLLFQNDELLSLLELKTCLQQSNLRFVYLNACDSGQQGTRNNGEMFLSNIRAALIAGVPLVLAMRWAILDHGAKLIAELFYKSFIKNGYPEIALQEAKREARGKLAQARDDVSWAAPMLIIH